MISSRRPGRLFLLGLTLCVTLAALGCATPGLPRPPSLNLPEGTRDLSATRTGNTVKLHFTVPSRSTDKLPLRGPHLVARFCRALDKQPCQPISTPQIVVPIDLATGRHSSFTWIDTLPEDLAQGHPRPLFYRVELFNISGRSAGSSAPAFTAAGDAPASVEGLSAQGSRVGILLRWNDPAQSGEILLQRENLAPKPDSKVPAIIQLAAPPATLGSAPATLLDTTAKPGIPYRYTATRRRSVEVSGHSVELLSAPSPSLEVTLSAIYPPPAPTGLTAVAFTSAENAFAIDLIWQPSDDTGLITPLAGYNLYRATTGEPVRLNTAPLTLPAFHDTTALPNTSYSYTVTAVDSKGNESAPASAVVQRQ